MILFTIFQDGVKGTSLNLDIDTGFDSDLDTEAIFPNISKWLSYCFEPKTSPVSNGDLSKSEEESMEIPAERISNTDWCRLVNAEQ